MSVNENDNGNEEMSSDSKTYNSDYVAALVKEKYTLDGETHLNTMKLIDQG